MVAPSPDSAAALVAAIRSGDVAAVRRIVADAPEIVAGPLEGPFGRRTPLHVVADWPGYFPNGPEIARLLLAAGADPMSRGPRDETPLPWAASSDDVDVAAALIDGGADIEALPGSIGTPLDNAVGYACWHGHADVAGVADAPHEGAPYVSMPCVSCRRVGRRAAPGGAAPSMRRVRARARVEPRSPRRGRGRAVSTRAATTVPAVAPMRQRRRRRAA